MARFETDFGRLPPEKRLTIEKLPQLTTDLEAAIERLRSWGVRVPVLGRLQSALAELGSIQVRGTYGTTEEELARAAEALFIARDFTTVTSVLPDATARVVAHQLAIAMKGSLEGRDSARAPYQFQTQFLFGAALTNAGLDPLVLPAGATGPDYIVCPGTVRYGVEVKRPETRRGVFDALRDARDQLAAVRLRGVVVFDLTDCLDEMGLRHFDGSIEYPPAVVRQPYKQLADDVSDLVWDWKRREHRVGFEKIFGIWWSLRGWQWAWEDTSAPHLFEFQGFHRFASASGNVWHHRGDEFHRRVVDGMRANGLHINAAEHESPQTIRRPFWEV